MFKYKSSLLLLLAVGLFTCFAWLCWSELSIYLSGELVDGRVESVETRIYTTYDGTTYTLQAQLDYIAAVSYLQTDGTAALVSCTSIAKLVPGDKISMVLTGKNARINSWTQLLIGLSPALMIVCFSGGFLIVQVRQFFTGGKSHARETSGDKASV